MFGLLIRNLRKTAHRTHREPAPRWIQFSCSVVRHDAHEVRSRTRFGTLWKSVEIYGL